MRGWTAAGLALGVLVAASLGIGAGDLSGADGGQLFLASRLPRTAAAILAGAGLALAGAVVQMAVQNRLVEPGLTGTPESAMAGLLAVTLIAPGTSLLGKMIVASVAALAGTAGFLLLARHIPREDPILLPLVGLVYGGILGSAVTWIGWTTDLMLALLPQVTPALPRLTVADLVTFGRWPHHRGRPDDQDRRIVAQAIRDLDLDDLLDRRLDTLSGGQRQRAFIAMNHAQSTPWMLLDEPLSALDPRYASDIMARLVDLSRPGRGRAIVVVMHDLAMAVRHADWVICLKGGRLFRSGPPPRR